MSTYVLVHGAWHGGWCWDRVAARLREDGHDVHTPTLAGLDGAAPVGDVGLHTHADQVVELIAGADLEEVVLVGHSYAGFVVREAADRVPERVGRLVLVDAWVGTDGESIDTRAPAWFRDWVDANTTDGSIAIPAAAAVGVTRQEDVDWIGPLLSPQPRRTFSEATRLSGRVESVPCTAVVCAPGNGVPFAAWAREFGWDVAEIASGHDVMVTAPDELARLLR